jgi:S1-C subfamily serine protease
MQSRYQPPQQQHFILKKHHKIFIGSFTTVVIVYMIIMAILVNGIIVKQTINNKDVNKRLDELQADTQTKLNDVSINMLQLQKTILSLNKSVESQINLLKASTSQDFSGIIEQSIPSVVTIRTDVAQGTGFIITDNGYLITNAHVLVGGREVFAITPDQEMIEAEFVGYDSVLDIALLKIPGEYEGLKLVDSDNVQVGEKVIAIGNPLGLQFSVSEGIVSGVNRRGMSNGLEAYIQTDAALNPGNSGGPLINKQGKVIGINNFKIGGGESLGFALESNYIEEAVNKIYMTAKNQTLI